MPYRCCNFNSAMLALTLCLVAGGCQSAAKQHLAAVARFDACEPAQAVEALTLASEKRGAETEILAVDRSIAALMAGDAATAETLLRQTRQQMDFLRQKDLREQTQSVLTDDKAIAWAGREFEQRMVDNLLVLASLMNDRGDSYAYASQVMDLVAAEHADLKSERSGPDVVAVAHSEHPQQDELPAPPRRLAGNAFSAYLSAVVNSEHAMNADLTDRTLQQVAYWKPKSADLNTPSQQNIRAGFGTQAAKGHGTVHVIIFSGRITDWESETAAPTSAALLLADQILSAIGDHTLPPTVAPVKIARPVRRKATGSSGAQLRFPPTAGEFDVLESTYVSPSTLVDLNAVAWASYHHNRDEQLARAVARRIVKKGAVYAAKDQLAIANDSGADLLMNLGGMAWEALERADRRHVRLLPQTIEAVQAELPVGFHEIEIRYGIPSKALLVPPIVRGRTVNVDVQDGRNTFVLCFRPCGDPDEWKIVTSK